MWEFKKYWGGSQYFHTIIKNKTSKASSKLQ